MSETKRIDRDKMKQLEKDAKKGTITSEEETKESQPDSSPDTNEETKQTET